MKKFKNESGHFEDAAKFNWNSMECCENRRCLCVSIAVCDNPSKSISSVAEIPATPIIGHQKGNKKQDLKSIC